MYNKISSDGSFQGKLMAALTLFALIIFNTQFVNAQANTDQPAQKQTNTQTKPAAVATKIPPTSKMEQAPVKPALDVFNGKTFDVNLTEKGKTESQKDQLIFADKKFKSKLSEAKGFPKSDYLVTEANGITSFQTKTNSPSEGIMNWKGRLNGDVVSGSAILIKTDKTSVVYTFSGKVAGVAAKAETKPAGK